MAKQITRHRNKSRIRKNSSSRLFTLKKGGLIKFGYSLKDGRNTRIKALKQAVKKLPYKTLISKLNVLTILHKNTHPEYAINARSDLEWVQKNR